MHSIAGPKAKSWLFLFTLASCRRRSFTLVLRGISSAGCEKMPAEEIRPHQKKGDVANQEPIDVGFSR